MLVRIARLTVFALSLFIMGRPCAAQPIAFVVNGKLMTQSVEGGAVRPASDDEKLDWKRQSVPPQTTAPGGKAYAFNGAEERDSPIILKAILSLPGNQIILDSNRIAPLATTDMIGYRYLRFAGWLDSRRFLMDGSNTNSGGGQFVRCGIDAYTGRIISFGGWAMPGGHIGIATNVEGKISDVVYFLRDKTGTQTGETTKSELRYYAVRLPSDLGAYRLKDASPRLLTVNGQPLEFSSGFGFVFSPNEQWAIFRLEQSGDNIDRTTSYLFSTATGKGRKLKGGDARFMSRWTTGAGASGNAVTLSVEERRKLNTFFSNFSEAGVKPFGQGAMTDEAMIDFAIMHQFLNGRVKNGPFEYLGNGRMRLSTGKVDSTCLYFLGRKPTEHRAIAGYPLQGGGYIVRDADGESFPFSQIQRLRRREDGLFEADVNDYDRPGISWEQDQDPPKKWKPEEGGHELPTMYRRMRAVMRKVAGPEKPHYILLEYREEK